ncbi:MAG: phosphoenolpyruvate--protein phosphotransferase [Defluviitaleaceae bacterium]|nr:phosphoenolpyruvate--protein phosphotransferase [Defluviitaleaceae bacterium]
MYRGIGACDGIVIAKAFVLKKEDAVFAARSVLSAEEEVKRYNNAVKKFVEDTTVLAAQVEKNAGVEQASIIEAHAIMANDPDVKDSVLAEIKDNMATAEAAVVNAFTSVIAMFSAMPDEYMRERAHDLADIKARILEILTGKKRHSIEDISQECIIIARDMTPSETGRINKTVIKGVITEIGGITGHMAIMAKAMELPTVLGMEGMLKNVQTGDTIALDGSTGEVIINPTEADLARYKNLASEYDIYKKELEVYKNRQSITLDGVHVEIAANIGGTEDLEAVIKNNADGIGLFRTEFLFMGRDSLPNEDTQFEVYKKVTEAMGDKPVIIRTLDIGGDKDVPYLDMKKEENPFLGYRAIRLCLGNKEMFSIQLRALLRASRYGNIKIMLPMISTVTELRQAKAIIFELKTELEKEGKPFNKDIQIGIMIETPASCLIADILAKEADFFSIGTNDLTQYTMAVDRGNEKVQYLYSTYEPAVMRSIYNVIKSAKKAGIMVGMCGESAGDVNMIPFLLACGLDEFSMSAQSILRAKKEICNLSKQELEKQIDVILNMSSREDIYNYCNRQR